MFSDASRVNEDRSAHGTKTVVRFPGLAATLMSFEKVLPERQHHPVINGTTDSHYTEGTKVSVATSGKLLLKVAPLPACKVQINLLSWVCCKLEKL